MPINHLFAALMLLHAVLAFDWSMYSLHLDLRRKNEKMIICFLGVFSGIWSLGFGLMYICETIQMAYYFRSLGLIGVFGFLLTFMLLVGNMAEVSQKVKHFGEVLSLLGSIVFLIGVLPNQVIFSFSEWGITYAPVRGIFSYFYTIYFFVCAAFILYEILFLLKNHKRKSIIKMTKKLTVAGIIVMLGMFLDTIFPMFGYQNIPGSSIFQFYAFAMISIYINLGKSTPTMANISKYVYESLSTPILVYNDKHELILFNNAAELFFDMKREEIYSFQGYYRDFFEMDVENPLEFEGDKSEVRASFKRRNVHCNIQIDKIYDRFQDVIGFLVTIHDISDLESMVHSLEEANNAKNIFLANMSHEVRTPMSSIMGFTELLSKTSLEGEQKEYVSNIMEASESLLGIVDNVLDITKVQAGTIDFTREPYDLKKNLSLLATKYETEAKKKGITFKAMLEDKIPDVLVGDIIRIRMLLNVLLTNALRETSVGFVVLESSMISCTESSVLIRIQIRDSGSGVGEEEKEAYFDAFEGANNGNMLSDGLQLSIAKSYIESIGGSVCVESILGKGTTTTISFEQEIAPEGTVVLDDCEKRTDTAMSDFKLDSNEVLVVDDNYININLARKCLERYGLNVSTALSGAQSVELCRVKDFALIFMDQMMPEMDGIEAMTRIRALSPYYAKDGVGKIIALTADALKGTREKLLAVGFDEYLSKPLEFDKLEQVLKKYLDMPLDLSHAEPEPENDESSKEQQEEQMEEAALQIPGVDVAKGIGLCGNSMNIYQEILSMAIPTGREKMAAMEHSKTDDMKSFIIDIHAVKGICYNIGADEMGDKAKALEFAGKEGRQKDIEEQYPLFAKEFEAFLQMLEELLIRRGILTSAKTQPEILYADILLQVKQAVDNFDFPQAEKRLASLDKVSLTEEEREEATVIGELVDAIDLDQLYPVLEKALNRYGK